MRKIKKIPVFLLALVLCIGMMAIPAFAASSTQDGIQVTLAADKESYSQGEQITAVLTVTNTNETAVSNVSLENVIPEGYELADGSEATKQVESLKAGETVTLTAVYTAEDAGVKETDQESDSSAESDTEKQPVTGGPSDNTGAGILPETIRVTDLALKQVTMPISHSGRHCSYLHVQRLLQSLP